jgi:hypothetical protein
VTIGGRVLELLRSATGLLTALVAPLALVTIFPPAAPEACWLGTGIPGFVPSAAPPRTPSPNTVAPAASFALRLFIAILLWTGRAMFRHGVQGGSQANPKSR